MNSDMSTCICRRRAGGAWCAEAFPNSLAVAGVGDVFQRWAPALGEGGLYALARQGRGGGAGAGGAH